MNLVTFFKLKFVLIEIFQKKYLRFFLFCYVALLLEHSIGSITFNGVVVTGEKDQVVHILYNVIIVVLFRNNNNSP